MEGESDEEVITNKPKSTRNGHLEEETDSTNFRVLLQSENHAEKQARRMSSRVKNAVSPDSSGESSEGNNNGKDQSNLRPTRKGRFVKGTSLLAALKESKKRNETIFKRKSPQKYTRGARTMETNQYTVLSSIPDVGMCSLLDEVSAVKNLSSLNNQTNDDNTKLTRSSIATSKISDDDSDILSPEICLQSTSDTFPLTWDSLDLCSTKAPLLWALDNMKFTNEEETDWLLKANAIWMKWKCLPIDVQTHYIELAQNKTDDQMVNFALHSTLPIAVTSSPTVARTPASHSSSTDNRFNSSYTVHYTTTKPSLPLLTSSSIVHSKANLSANDKIHCHMQKKGKTKSSKHASIDVITARSPSTRVTSKNFLHVSDEWKNTLKAKVNEMIKRRNDTTLPLQSTSHSQLPNKKKVIHGCSNKLSRPPMMKASSPSTLHSVQDQPNDITTVQSSIAPNSLSPPCYLTFSPPQGMNAGSSFALTDAINYAELERQYRYAQAMLEHHQLYVESLKSRIVQARIQQQILLLNSEHYQMCSKKVVLPTVEPDETHIPVLGYKTNLCKSLSNDMWKGSFDKPSIEINDFYKSLID